MLSQERQLLNISPKLGRTSWWTFGCIVFLLLWQIIRIGLGNAHLSGPYFAGADFAKVVGFDANFQGARHLMAGAPMLGAAAEQRQNSGPILSHPR